MPIQVWDYRSEYEVERSEILAAVDQVFRSGRLILGERVRTFEERFAAYCGAHYGVGVNSGTDALFLALKALGVGPGDEVVTVANTAVPTVAAIVATGATPRFVDVDASTYLMDVDQLDDVMTPATKCVIPVHLFGQCVRMERVREIAARHHVKILEDCAQSHGATRHGIRCGALGDVAAFSFYPTKILGGYGDGGMVVTSDAQVAASVRRLRMYGMEREYYSEEQGYNSRLDEVQAAILTQKLPRLGAYIERRRALAARYDSALGDLVLGRPGTLDGNGHAYYLYVARHALRDRIIEALAGRQILVNVSYRWPIHVMRAYAWLGYKEGDLPRTEAAAREIFSLPMYPSLTDEQQDSVIAALRDIIAGLAATDRDGPSSS